MSARLDLYLGGLLFYQRALNRVSTMENLPLEGKAFAIAVLVRALREETPPDVAADVHRQLVGAGEDAVRVLAAAANGADATAAQADLEESARITVAAITRLLEQLGDSEQE